MTLREKVAEVKPEDVDAVYIGGVLLCPWEYDFLGVKKECPYPELKVCVEHCEKCWDRKYIEPEVQDA